MADDRAIRTLDYAPARPLQRIARRFAWALSTLVILAALCIKGPAMWHRALALYWEHQCRNFAPAGANDVVFDWGSSQPSAMPRGFVASPFFNLAGTGMNFPYASATWRTPNCWLEVDRLENLGQFNPLTQPRSTVFVHERQSPSGMKRILIAEVNSMSISISDPELELICYCLNPSTLSRPATLVCGYDDIPGFTSGLLTVVTPPQKYFAGLADPVDLSHFTVDYQWDDGARGTLDCWLKDDGTVRVQARPGPGDFLTHVRKTYPHYQ